MVPTRPWNDLGTTIPRRGNALTTFLARALMRLFGWRMTGELPDLPKMVIAAGPHTSNWDFLVGVGAMYSAGFKVSFLGKDSLFRPPLGWIMRSLGGRPVDRTTSHGLVGEYIRQVRESDKFILALAPEGTRKPTGEWKTGFWHVARGAHLPIVLGFFDYGTKTVGFGPILWPGELEEDMRTIQNFYASITAKRPENFQTTI
ncbi:MAG TPA: lysophospholipid acyltransferase family protein [Gemmatimonadales bacterium]|nr:lysophospholipid acyltransferase family protein [Gemmatimonadales bacterium]